MFSSERQLTEKNLRYYKTQPRARLVKNQFESLVAEINDM